MKKFNHFWNFKNYDLTLTCEVKAGHGISGHVFELIEYFYYFRFYHNVNCCIFFPFSSVTEEIFKKCLEKYTFTKEEIDVYNSNTFFDSDPKIIDSNIHLVVDGNLWSPVFKGIIKAKKKIFLMCNNFETLDKADIILQDSRIYEDLPNSFHYVKKILFDKFKKVNECKTNTGLIYGTTNCRKVDYDYLEEVDKEYNLDDYVVLSNEDFSVPRKFRLLRVPVDDVYSLFKTYIYTDLKGTCKMDCSPRFIAECKYYNRNVKYFNKFWNLGLKVRKYDIENNFEKLFLTKEDKIIDYL